MASSQEARRLLLTKVGLADVAMGSEMETILDKLIELRARKRPSR